MFDLKKAAFLTTLMIAGTSCTPDESQEPARSSDSPQVITVESCDGKCDGFDNIADIFDDMKDVEVDDLVALSSPLATDAVNDALGQVDFAKVELSPTTLYSTERELFGEVVTNDLGELSAGLTERLGEKDFTSEIIELRRQTAASDGALYAESHFVLGAELGHNMGMNAGDAVGNVGFRAGANVEAIAISKFAADDQIEAVLRQPLEAVKSARGFVLPRSVEDFDAMAPGESLALRADGALGMNIGAGVPFLLASVGSALTVHARLSLAARAALEGKLDVQIIRGAGDALFVDVGLSKAKIRSINAALKPGFGVDAIPDVDVDLGPTTVSLGELANDAIRDQLQQKLDIQASAGASSEDNRLRVARFEFDLANASSDEIEQAIAQLSRGDMRLAQALARREGAGVRQVIDMTKESHHHDFRAGFNFLSLRFYAENGTDTGRVTIDTEDGSQTLLFTELHSKRGLFFTDRESSWRTLVSIEQANGQDVRGQVNVRHIIREGQDFFDRDALLDHVDSALAIVIGHDATVEIADQIDLMARHADDTCDEPDQDASFGEDREYRECLAAMPQDPEIQGMANEVRATLDRVLEGQVTGFGLDGRQGAELASELVEFQIELASVGFNNGAQMIPDGQIISEVRISDAGVHELMQLEGADRFMSALETSLRVMESSRRNRDLEDKHDDVDDHIEDNQERFGKIRGEFLDAAVAFQDLDRAARTSFEGAQVGNQSNLILVHPDKSIELRTIAEHKGKLLEDFVPDLIDVADGSIFTGLGEPELYVVGYALIGAVSPQHVEWLYTANFDQDEDLTFDTFSFYTIGTRDLIDAGVFDLDTLLGAKP